MMKSKIDLWSEVSERLSTLKVQELALRNEIFREVFPLPLEGVNTAQQDGLVIKATHKINRTVDVATLSATWDSLQAQKIPVDLLIKNTPELVLSVYRTLLPSQRLVFDNVLVIKPGAPSLEVKK